MLLGSTNDAQKTRKDQISLIPNMAFLAAWSHVAHRARVEPGPNISVLYGPMYHTYFAPPPDYWEPQKEAGRESRDLQMNAGYAWKIKQDRRLLIQAVLLSDFEQALILHSFDFYYQTKSFPSNGGIGIMLGLDPRLYFMVGRDYGKAHKTFGTGLDFCIGFGLAGISVIPQFMYTVRLYNLQATLTAEYRYFLTDADICDENCSQADNIHSRLFVGMIISFDSR